MDVLIILNVAEFRCSNHPLFEKILSSIRKHIDCKFWRMMDKNVFLIQSSWKQAEHVTVTFTDRSNHFGFSFFRTIRKEIIKKRNRSIKPRRVIGLQI